MPYRIEKKAPMRIVGVRIQLTYDMDKNFKLIPSFWEQTKQSKMIHQILNLNNTPQRKVFGISIYNENDEVYYYIATETDKPVPEGMYEYEIPASLWAVFESQGPFKESMQKIYKGFFTEWLPFSGYTYAETDKVRRSIACVAQKTSIDTYLSLKENMMFQSKLYKIPKAEAEERMKTLIFCFSLEGYLDYPVSCYSGGVKRRLDIALNLMSNPQILFLDEPTVGMDIQSRMAMWKMMKKIRDEFETTIFLTTHYLEEADDLSDTICIMKDGKEVLQGTPSELREIIKQDILSIRFINKKNAKACFEELNKVRNDIKLSIRDEKILIYSKQSREDFKTVNQWLIKKQIKFEGIEIVQSTLDDVFLRLTEENGLEEIS